MAYYQGDVFRQHQTRADTLKYFLVFWLFRWYTAKVGWGWSRHARLHTEYTAYSQSHLICSSEFLWQFEYTEYTECEYTAYSRLIICSSEFCWQDWLGRGDRLSNDAWVIWIREVSWPPVKQQHPLIILTSHTTILLLTRLIFLRILPRIHNKTPPYNTRPIQYSSQEYSLVKATAPRL